MKKENIRDIIIFVVLLILILLVIIYNIYKEKSVVINTNNNKYIFNKYDNNQVYKEGMNLFFRGVELLNPNNAFKFELTGDNKYKLYSFDNYNDLRKIINYSLVTKTLNNNDIELYNKEHNIIEKDGNYFIDIDKNQTNNYVGSKINIESYDDNNVVFKSINYFCKEYSYNYIGYIDELPNCDYIEKESIFSVIEEDNNLRLKDYNEIKNILQ